MAYFATDGTTTYIDDNLENFIDFIRAELSNGKEYMDNHELTISAKIVDPEILKNLPEFDGF